MSEKKGDVENTDMQNYIANKSELVSLFKNRTCKGICRNFIASKPHGDRYANGQVRCTQCMVYMTQKGVVINQGGKKLCKCCHCPVRTRPRHSELKEAYRQKMQNQSEPTDLFETIESVEDEIVEESMGNSKKSTPVFDKTIDKKLYHDLRNFIENEIQLKANYQLVMLKYLLANKAADKGEIAESIAYFNNKDTSQIEEVKKFLNIPVYDVLIKHGFVKVNRGPDGRKIYEFNVHLSEFEHIEINELLEKKIEQWNNDHGIPDNQFESTGIDWFENKELIAEPNYWLWSVTPENWEIVKKKNVWGSEIPAKQIQNQILPGDIIIFYVSGTKEFQGIFRITGKWFDSSDQIWTNEIQAGEIIYHSRVNLEPIAIGRAKIENLNDLLIFEGKDQNRANLVLKGNAGYPGNNNEPIPSSDYQAILNIIQTNPELIEKPMSNEPPEVMDHKNSEVKVENLQKLEENFKGFEMGDRGLIIQEFNPIKTEIVSIGQILTNDELSQKFGVGNMGGIRFSRKNNVIVLCDTNFVAYNNQLDSDFGILFYSGEGQTGNQELAGGNLRLVNSRDTPIFYFVEVPQEPGMKKKGALDNRYRLIGKVHYLKHIVKTENDVSGKPRQIIKFLFEVEK